MFNLDPRCIGPLRPSTLCTSLGSIQSQPRILHRPTCLHRKRNMRINRRRHGAIKSTYNLIILRQPCVPNLVKGRRIFSKSTAKVVLCAKEFGTGERGAGEGVVEGFGRWFCGGFGEGCLGFCCGGGGGDVCYFFLNRFAQVDEGFFLNKD